MVAEVTSSIASTCFNSPCLGFSLAPRKKFGLCGGNRQRSARGGGGAAKRTEASGTVAEPRRLRASKMSGPCLNLAESAFSYEGISTNATTQEQRQRHKFLSCYFRPAVSPRNEADVPEMSEAKRRSRRTIVTSSGRHHHRVLLFFVFGFRPAMHATAAATTATRPHGADADCFIPQPASTKHLLEQTVTMESRRQQLTHLRDSGTTGSDQTAAASTLPTLTFLLNRSVSPDNRRNLAHR